MFIKISGYVFMYVCMYVCMHVCMYIWIIWCMSSIKWCWIWYLRISNNKLFDIYLYIYMLAFAVWGWSWKRWREHWRTRRSWSVSRSHSWDVHLGGRGFEFEGRRTTTESGGWGGESGEIISTRSLTHSLCFWWMLYVLMLKPLHPTSVWTSFIKRSNTKSLSNHSFRRYESTSADIH